jgi:hypothetical protein
LTIDGITFTLKDRKEATEILDHCTDFDGNNLVYDSFNIQYLDTDDTKNHSFWWQKTKYVAVKLDLETYPAHHAKK